MMLGDMLAAARRSTGTIPDWLGAADPELARRMEAAADKAGETPAGYARSAVALFDRFATEEEWATLTSRLRGGGAPGTACLLAMIEWRLNRETSARDAVEGERR